MSNKKNNLAVRLLPSDHDLIKPIPAKKGSNQHDIAVYIANTTLELRNMAKHANLPFLAYLLEIAFQEAFDLSGPMGSERSEAPPVALVPSQHT